MISKLTCRIAGWIFTILAGFGFTVGHLGDYMMFSRFDTWLCLVIGILYVAGARRRQRVAVATALVIGGFLLAIGILGLSGMYPELLVADPLESATRLLTGAWTTYAAASDIFTWRRYKLHPAS